MTNTCALCVLSVGLASAATPLAIRFKASTPLPEIAAGKVIASTVIPNVIANLLFLPCLFPEASGSKKSAQAALRPAAEGKR